jgi:predicted transcriptional regulator
MQGLGELEAAVMDVLWRAERPTKVRDVLERLDTGKPLAYTTVLTVLDNLHRKGWVQRELHGRAYHYRPL